MMENGQPQRSCDEISAQLHDVIAVAQSNGIEAEVMYVGGQHCHVDYTQGGIENWQNTYKEAMGIRLIKDQRQAIATTNLPSALTPQQLILNLLPQLQVLPPDPYCGLAQVGQLYQGQAWTDQGDDSHLSAETLIDRARALWQGVMDIPGIRHSSGSTVAAVRQRRALITSRGFFGGYSETRYSQNVSAISGDETCMEEDYSYDGRLFWQDLRPINQSIAEAGQRALQRQNPKPVGNFTGAVIMENRIAGQIVAQIMQALNAAQRIRRATFLQDKDGELIASKYLTVTDDPFQYRCFSGAPFDDEGLAKTVQTPIKNGVLQTWISDLSSARAMQTASTAQAVRVGLEQPPQPGMVHTMVRPTMDSVADIIADTRQGLWVTELIGRGLDVVTGQYSCGAVGFAIENGCLTYPFRNVTIASDARDILRHIYPANDILQRGSSQIPSLYLGFMTISGGKS